MSTKPYANIGPDIVIGSNAAEVRRKPISLSLELFPLTGCFHSKETTIFTYRSTCRANESALYLFLATKNFALVLCHSRPRLLLQEARPVWRFLLFHQLWKDPLGKVEYSRKSTVFLFRKCHLQTVKQIGHSLSWLCFYFWLKKEKSNFLREGKCFIFFIFRANPESWWDNETIMTEITGIYLHPPEQD